MEAAASCSFQENAGKPVTGKLVGPTMLLAA
jgi:hypothetical protein